MKIAWNNGYYPQPIELTVAVTDGICLAHARRGDKSERRVAVLDGSAGEYDPITLCHECLVDLANELL